MVSTSACVSDFIISRFCKINEILLSLWLAYTLILWKHRKLNRHLNRNRQLYSGVSVEYKSVQFLAEDHHSLEKPPKRDYNTGLSGVIQTSSKCPLTCVNHSFQLSVRFALTGPFVLLLYCELCKDLAS